MDSQCMKSHMLIPFDPVATLLLVLSESTRRFPQGLSRRTLGDLEEGVPGVAGDRDGREGMCI